MRVVMMPAMMLPSLTPALSQYRRAARARRRRRISGRRPAPAR
jgi:predicted metal-binding membrane protein